jgi:hypothetical protein
LPDFEGRNLRKVEKKKAAKRTTRLKERDGIYDEESFIRFLPPRPADASSTIHVLAPAGARAKNE